MIQHVGRLGGPAAFPAGSPRLIGAPGSDRSRQPEEDTVQLGRLIGALLRRKWLIILITVLGAVIGLALGLRVVPEYRATAQIMFDPRQLRILDSEQVLEAPQIGPTAMATQIGLLQSRDFIGRVMDRLNLLSDPEFNASLRSEPRSLWRDWLRIAQERVLELLPLEWRQLVDGRLKELPILESDAPLLTRERSIVAFADQLTVAPNGSSTLITIGFRSPDPVKAATIANGIASLFIEDQITDKIFLKDKASGWLDQRLAELREEVQNADRAVQEFKASNNIVEAAGASLNDQQLAELNRELVQARADLAEKQAKLRLARDLRGSTVGLEALGDVAASSTIQNLRAQVTELARQEAELRTLFGGRHPRMLQLQEEQAKVAAGIRAEVERVGRTLDNDVQIASIRVASIENSLRGLTSRSVEAGSASVQLQELGRVAAANRTLYEQLLQRASETRDQQAMTQADAQLVTAASTPVLPVTPSPKLFAAAGLTVSLLVGAFLALLLDRLDGTMRSAAAVERALGLRTLGLVPRVRRLRRDQRAHHYLLAKPLSLYAESVRGVYAALRQTDPEHPPKVMLVTSSLPDEGKTTFVVSLATLLARSQRRVLIIDLDLRHPSVHRELGREVSTGLVEYIAGQATLEQVIHHDSATGLDFIAVQGRTLSPADLIESPAMRELIRRCAEAYDFVLLDAAPTASVTDTRMAAGLADHVLFVVRWGNTIESAARDSVLLLRDAGVEPAGAVLTQVDLRKHARYGYGDIGQYYTRSRRYYVN
jgi:capsular exopolysaccharide synthesis family protein